MFSVRGSLPRIIRNDERVYEGTLVSYFKAVFNGAQNLHHPYHNFRHTFHVVWLCYQACIFHLQDLTPRQMRNLLVAAMFHDFDHPGMMGNDDLNIQRAIRGLRQYVEPEDVDHLEDIERIIWATQFPYTTESITLSLSEQIIRDADMGQSFAMAWLQQVILGLAKEWQKKPIDILKAQPAFLQNVQFCTPWGQKMFPREEVEAKVREANELIELLA